MIITMALLTQSIKGTQDTLPAKSYQNQYMEQSMLEIARNFGYHEIRTPVFEHTELFQRSGRRYHRCGAERNVHLRR